MKKSSLKRALPVQLERVMLQKPFGFCCDKKNPDLETHFDKQKPPFKSSLTDVDINSGGPGLKFRIQETTSLPYANQRVTSKIRSAAFLGDCKRCHPPLSWYLEDEIELARDMFATKRQAVYNSEMDQNVEIAKRKEKWRKRKKTRKMRRKS